MRQETAEGVPVYFTSCKACDEILHVTWIGQQTHPGCPQAPEEIAARAFVDAIQRGDESEAQRLEAQVNKIDAPPSLGSAALWYASVGWAVFPLAPVGYTDPRRPEYVGDGKKPYPGTRGLKWATTDADQIRASWTAKPDSNIGVITGEFFEVLDVDGPEGYRSVISIQDKIPDVHGKVLTPHGEHLLIKPEGNGNRAGVLPGLDVRGVGGYVVAPPSVINGQRYTWAIKPSPAILGGKSHG